MLNRDLLKMSVSFTWITPDTARCVDRGLHGWQHWPGTRWHRCSTGELACGLKSTAKSVEWRHMSKTCHVMTPDTNDKCNNVAWHARHLWPASSTWLAPKSMCWLWCSWDPRAKSQGQARFRNSTKLLAWISAFPEAIQLGLVKRMDSSLLGAAMAVMLTLSGVSMLKSKFSSKPARAAIQQDFLYSLPLKTKDK